MLSKVLDSTLRIAKIIRSYTPEESIGLRVLESMAQTRLRVWHVDALGQESAAFKG